MVRHDSFSIYSIFPFTELVSTRLSRTIGNLKLSIAILLWNIQGKQKAKKAEQTVNSENKFKMVLPKGGRDKNTEIAEFSLSNFTSSIDNNFI